MRGAGSQLAFDFGGNAGTGRPRPVRKVRRDETMRLVEYAPFPRVQRGPQWRHGFTLDLSPRGLCVRAKDVAPIGSLLRIILRSVDGQPALDGVARVRWTERSVTGGQRMGLEVIARKQPQRARREARVSTERPLRERRPISVRTSVAPQVGFLEGKPLVPGEAVAIAS